MGADVTSLGPEDLATGDLSAYGAIVVGTRAYAVRRDLINYNQRLLDYARAGGNLVILYQTQEFVPAKWAAFPADLPAPRRGGFRGGLSGQNPGPGPRGVSPSQQDRTS